jgi:hypothetical protein
MGLFFFRFWPVLLPLAVYAAWLFTMRRTARKNGLPGLRFRDGPWYWAVLASLVMALACFLAMGLSVRQEKGAYVPPHMAKGELVPGHVEPAP